MCRAMANGTSGVPNVGRSSWSSEDSTHDQRWVPGGYGKTVKRAEADPRSSEPVTAGTDEELIARPDWVD